ncbi:hypothetical protein D3C76_915430 [compost metagenome]
MIAERPGVRVVGTLPAIAEQQVYRRKIATPRELQFLVSGEAAVHALADFRVVLQGALYGLGKRHRITMDG